MQAIAMYVGIRISLCGMNYHKKFITYLYEQMKIKGLDLDHFNEIRSDHSDSLHSFFFHEKPSTRLRAQSFLFVLRGHNFLAIFLSYLSIDYALYIKYSIHYSISKVIENPVKCFITTK